MIYLGIDPGKRGGVAHFELQEPQGGDIIYASCGVYPTTITPGKTRKILGGLSTERVSKDEYDIKGMVRLLRAFGVKDVFCTIEHQQNMPKHIIGSSYSEFSLGYGYGLWIGILETLELPYRTVRARDWHSVMLVGAQGDDTKKKSVDAATRKWPGLSFLRTPRSRKPDHGLTDAALIADYGMKMHDQWLKDSSR